MTASLPPSFLSLGETWRRLEERLPASFFQSWTWVGCLAEERYDRPVLLQAEQDGRLVGLALFNRRGRSLHLAESGRPELDRPFIEHNGPLAEDVGVAAALLGAALRLKGVDRVRVSGALPALVELPGTPPARRRVLEARYVDLDRVRAAGAGYLATLSANTRQQIRRSTRLLAPEGEPAVERAATPAELDAWWQELLALHGARWDGRNRPGAFSTPFLRRFHQTLMREALARGELDLLRMAGRGGTIGLLYNFRYRGRVYAYQSGLAPRPDQPQAKPGLSCHALAIDAALARGDSAYDFLAGDYRYKSSLARETQDLAWVEFVRPWSPIGLGLRLRRLLGRGA